MPQGHKPPTLCWDCRRARGDSEGCTWSRWFEPVEGWDAEKSDLYIDRTRTITSYTVRRCPRFLRDAYDGGQRRLTEGAKADEVHL